MKPSSSRGKRVYVEVSPSRLEVVAVTGGSAASRMEHPATVDWNAQWPGVLAGLDGPLARMVGELGATGCPATIVYSGPTATAGVFPCPAIAGKAAVDQAARLALTGLCSFPLDDNASQVVSLRTDASQKQTDGTQTPVQTHTLGVADTDASAEAVAQWASRAGLTVERLVPAEAAGMIAALRAAEAVAAGGEVRAALFFGEHASVLAAVHGERLSFVRSLGVGTESLVDALIRPIRPRGSAEDGTSRSPITLDRDAARVLLEASGIPAADQVIDKQRGIEGAAVLPLLQPVLQRVAIEVKQSLRFGIEEAAKSPVRLVVIGPGATIPRLSEIVARQCGLETAATGPGPVGDAGCGLIAGLRRAADVAPGILPRSLERAGMLRLVRHGVWAGLAASVCLVAWDAYSVRSALGREQARLEQLQRQAAPMTNSTPMQEQAQAARDRVSAFDEKIREQMGEWVDWSAVLALLGERTPESVRLTGLELSAASGASCKLSGYVDSASAMEAASVIGGYMTALGAAPVVRSVDLGTTQHVRRENKDVQQFELSINLIGLPAVARAAVKGAGPTMAGVAGAP